MRTTKGRPHAKNANVFFLKISHSVCVSTHKNTALYCLKLYTENLLYIFGEINQICVAEWVYTAHLTLDVITILVAFRSAAVIE